mmetsp:Transcript_14515/g.41418  ORF Transcript_14515/g.41418 Transcript_14515/m.41418 type:complete len:225 (+) Transcript_14515:482-1156(+)
MPELMAVILWLTSRMLLETSFFSSTNESARRDMQSSTFVMLTFCFWMDSMVSPRSACSCSILLPFARKALSCSTSAVVDLIRADCAWSEPLASADRDSRRPTRSARRPNDLASSWCLCSCFQLSAWWSACLASRSSLVLRCSPPSAAWPAPRPSQASRSRPRRSPWPARSAWVLSRSTESVPSRLLVSSCCCCSTLCDAAALPMRSSSLPTAVFVTSWSFADLI